MKKLFNDALFIINGDDFSVRSESPMPKWSVSFRKPCSPGNDKKKNVSKKRVLVLCQQWSGAKWCLIIKIVKFTVFHFFFLKYLRSQFNWAMHVLWKIKNVNTIWALHAVWQSQNHDGALEVKGIMLAANQSHIIIQFSSPEASKINTVLLTVSPQLFRHLHVNLSRINASLQTNKRQSFCLDFSALI